MFIDYEANFSVFFECYSSHVVLFHPLDLLHKKPHSINVQLYSKKRNLIIYVFRLNIYKNNTKNDIFTELSYSYSIWQKYS